MAETGKATESDLHCVNNLNVTEELTSKGLITAQVDLRGKILSQK